MENKIKTSRWNRMITFAICSNSNNDITWFIVENDKLVPSEPCDHSIGTILMMSFFLKSHGNNIPLADSNSDITWFIDERDKIFQIEPRDHSIGTTSDSFFCSNSNSDVKLRMTS